MGDFSPSDQSFTGGKTCTVKGSNIYDGYYRKGTLFYKTDLNGYTARQFKTCVNNIEQVTLPSGKKKIFVLGDRGLFYLDNTDTLHRISIPLKNLPINIANIEDNYFIDTDGSRYYLDSNTGIYNKSIVDNSSNIQANLNYYTSKAFCKKYIDERNNETTMYVTSNGEYASWLFENYEGDRTWNAKVTDNGITFVFRDSIGNVFGIKNNGALTLCNQTNKKFEEKTCKYVVDENAEEIETETIINIKFVSELTVNETTYLFLMADGGVYYTPKINNTYDRNNFSLLNKVSVYNDGWTTEDITVTGTTTLNQNENVIIFSDGSKNIYCISSQLSWINNELSIIKSSEKLDSGVINIITDQNNIFCVTQRHNVLTTEVDESTQRGDEPPRFYNKVVVNGNSGYYAEITKEFGTMGGRRKIIPNGWLFKSYYLNTNTFNKNNCRFKFRIYARVYDYHIYKNHTFTYNLYKLDIIGNLFTSQILDVSDQCIYEEHKVTQRYAHDGNNSTFLREYEYEKINDKITLKKQTDYNLTDNHLYITWGTGRWTAALDAGKHIFGYVNQDHPYETTYDNITTTWSKVAYNTLVQSTTTSFSEYQLNMFQKNKLIFTNVLKNKPYFKGFHDIKKTSNGLLLATPFGLLLLNNNLKIDENNCPLIDITGDTDFREMYEITYNGGEYAGLWYVFTTSDGLINCRAGDPDDLSWNGDWRIYKYGTSFWKIRCSSPPSKDPETGKKMVSFSAFNVKYPSYIY